MERARARRTDQSHSFEAENVCCWFNVITNNISITLDRFHAAPTACLNLKSNFLFSLLCRTFGAKCAKCCRNIAPTDWVRRAKDQVFHLACFSCDQCGRQLSTGEQFAMIDEQVLCKSHYYEMDGSTTSSDGKLHVNTSLTLNKASETFSDGYDCDGFNKNKSKRIRTTFTEEQLQVLQANFTIDSNPDGQDLERIANMTGLSKRVTQVWFQNCRARQKKHKNPGHGDRSPIQTLLPIVPPDICMATSSRRLRETRFTSSEAASVSSCPNLTHTRILRKTWRLDFKTNDEHFDVKVKRLTVGSQK